MQLPLSVRAPSQKGLSSVKMWKSLMSRFFCANSGGLDENAYNKNLECADELR